jgi:hypothetical protein
LPESDCSPQMVLCHEARVAGFTLMHRHWTNDFISDGVHNRFAALQTVFDPFGKPLLLDLPLVFEPDLGWLTGGVPEVGRPQVKHRRKDQERVILLDPIPIGGRPRPRSSSSSGTGERYRNRRA